MSADDGGIVRGWGRNFYAVAYGKPWRILLGTLFVLWHEGDGISATVSVGASNMIDSGILVQATIIPARSSPPMSH